MKLPATHQRNKAIAAAKIKLLQEKWEGKTPQQFLAHGMYVCTRCRHTCSIDDAACKNCGTEKLIVTVTATAAPVRNAQLVFAEMIYKN